MFIKTLTKGWEVAISSLPAVILKGSLEIATLKFDGSSITADIKEIAKKRISPVKYKVPAVFINNQKVETFSHLEELFRVIRKCVQQSQYKWKIKDKKALFITLQDGVVLETEKKKYAIVRVHGGRLEGIIHTFHEGALSPRETRIYPVHLDSFEKRETLLKKMQDLPSRKHYKCEFKKTKGGESFFRVELHPRDSIELPSEGKPLFLFLTFEEGSLKIKAQVGALKVNKIRLNGRDIDEYDPEKVFGSIESQKAEVELRETIFERVLFIHLGEDPPLKGESEEPISDGSQSGAASSSK